MTDEQIRSAVAALRASDDEKGILLRRALAGEPEALFVVRALAIRQQAAK